MLRLPAVIVMTRLATVPARFLAASIHPGDKSMFPAEGGVFTSAWQPLGRLLTNSAFVTDSVLYLVAF